MSIDVSVHRASVPSPRVVFFGRRCQLSAIPLAALLQMGIDVQAILIPAREGPGRRLTTIRAVQPRGERTSLPMAGSSATPSVDELARYAGTPLYEVGKLAHQDILDVVSAARPDLIAVSCFPRLFPGSLLALAVHGGLNLHPSLLPRHRGPDPLFWVFRQRDARAGVTVHQMTGRLDAGPIVAQHAIDLSRGQDGKDLERQMAKLGGSLLGEAVWDAWRGSSAPVLQDESVATYESWPDEIDLRVPPDWDATQAFHFMAGVIPLGYAPLIAIDEAWMPVREVIGIGEEMRSDESGRNQADGMVSIPLRGGVLRVRLAAHGAAR